MGLPEHWLDFFLIKIHFGIFILHFLCSQTFHFLFLNHIIRFKAEFEESWHLESWHLRAHWCCGCLLPALRQTQPVSQIAKFNASLSVWLADVARRAEVRWHIMRPAGNFYKSVVWTWGLGLTDKNREMRGKAKGWAEWGQMKQQMGRKAGDELCWKTYKV